VQAQPENREGEESGGSDTKAASVRPGGRQGSGLWGTIGPGLGDSARL